MVKKIAFIVIGAILVFALGFSVNQLIAKDDKGAMNDEEARALVESLYGGQIQSFIQKGNLYKVTLENDFGEYELQIDQNRGKISSLVQTKKKEPPADDEQSQREQNDTERAKIGERRAVEIALTQVNGEVDDVELEEQDGSYVYVVEIETANDEEALVYVQAYTGEILSYTFED